MIKTFTVAAILSSFGWWVLRDGSVSLGPGILAPEAPVQTALESVEPFDHRGYLITPLAEFALRAKVLAKRGYASDREAALSPYDLALGWGSMSDETVLAHIGISQSRRWYHWSVARFPIPRRDIETQSANMHLIPASDDVLAAIAETRVGEIIRLRGRLVRVTSEDGWRWVSSTTRADTGSSACEVIWVEEFERVVR